MSYYSRLAIATRGFRGGAGQSLYISQTINVEENPDASVALLIEETVDVATVASSTLSVDVVDSVLSVTVDQDSPITVDIGASTQSVSVSTC
jgi:hypothetical protein